MDLFSHLRPSVTYYASGSNHAGEIQGFNDLGHAVGVSVERVGDDAMWAIRGLRVPLFCDSGAFGEVSMETGVPVIAKLISDDEWRSRLGTMLNIVEACPTEVSVVAPDCVGHQDVTLDRLRKYAPEVRRLADAGARVLVCVQLGPMSMADFWRAASAVAPRGAVPAIPMKKNAVSLQRLARFSNAVQPDDCHLLGLGENSARFAPAVDALGFAGCRRVTCDSVKIMAHVGRTNGPGGGPRKLTVAHDEAEAQVEDAVFAGDADLPDYTDAIYEADDWMLPADQRAFRDTWGVAGSIAEWLEQEAPNGEPWALDPMVQIDLDEAWTRYHRAARVGARKRRAIRMAFS